MKKLSRASYKIYVCLKELLKQANLYYEMITLDNIYIFCISAHLFFIFSLSRRRTSSRMWDKSRVGDLSTLPDHSNARDRTGGKLSVSTEL